jgi:ligand-binding sensor domain-containing protein
MNLQASSLYFKAFTVIFINLFTTQIILSQSINLGSPEIILHNQEIHKGGSQIYDIEITDQHIYFAKNSGLLNFDGIHWSVNPTPNNTIMRTISISSNGKIYIGSQNEIGFFETNKSGALEYNSIKDKLSEEAQQFSEIWDIETIGDKVFFLKDSDVFMFQDGKTIRFSGNERILDIGKIDSLIWYQTLGQGISIINNQTDSQLAGSEIFNDKVIVDIIKVGKDQFLIPTQQHGIYNYENESFSKWDTNADSYLQKNQISCAAKHKDVGLILGTEFGGCIVIDSLGQTRLALNKQSGLQNNKILNLNISPNKTLWVATEKGIEEVDLACNFTKFFPDNKLGGTVYHINKWNGYIYFSTSNGLYRIIDKPYYNPLENNQFELVKGTEGTAWRTNIINDQLYCAHNNGPLKISKSNYAEVISTEIYGAWKFIPLKNDFVALGAYDGVYLLKSNPFGNLDFVRKLVDLEESSRILLFDSNEYLWISHPYKKVYRYEFSEDYSSERFKVYDSSFGYQSDNRNYVFDINQTCYLTNESGVYIYNASIDSFQTSPILGPLFDSTNHVRSLKQIGNSIWAITNNYTSQLKIIENGLVQNIDEFKISDLNTAQSYIGGFEELAQYDKNSILVCSDNGVIEYSYDKSPQNKPQIFFKRIKLNNDSIHYFGRGSIIPIEMDLKNNEITFEFGEAFPNSNSKLMYQYRLIGSEKEWSPLTKLTSKTFSNLPAKDYVFEARAINDHNIESNVSSIAFEINAPWYITNAALILYLSIIAGGIYFMFRKQKKNHQVTTDSLIREKQKTEEEIEVIKREKLESEINHKNQELASSTLHLLQKNQTLNTIRTKISELQKQMENPKLKKELSKIFSILRDDFNMDEDWDKFSIHFDQVHQDFIKKLKEKYPNLSTNDHKLCAYLKMNLATKEIAPLLNISVRGVEISRYRLRKKLELDRAVNLNDFFNSEI